jgi:hypothetical protein
MKIIDEKELQILKRKVLLGKVGWLLLTASLVGLAFERGSIHSMRKSLKEVAELKDEIRSIQQEQALVNEKFVTTLNSQNVMAETLIAWTSLLKSKTDIINENRVASKEMKPKPVDMQHPFK